VFSSTKNSSSFSLFSLCQPSYHYTRSRAARGAGRVCKCQQACYGGRRGPQREGSARATTSIGDSFFILRLTESAKRPRHTTTEASSCHAASRHTGKAYGHNTMPPQDTQLLAHTHTSTTHTSTRPQDTLLPRQPLKHVPYSCMDEPPSEETNSVLNKPLISSTPPIEALKRINRRGRKTSPPPLARPSWPPSSLLTPTQHTQHAIQRQHIVATSSLSRWHRTGLCIIINDICCSS